MFNRSNSTANSKDVKFKSNMAASRTQSESDSVVNTKFGARPIIDLPAFAFGSRGHTNSNIADVPQRMFGPKEYSYNVGRNVPRDNSNGGYVGQYYNFPNQSSPRGVQNPNSNFVKESNVIPYPSYTTVPNMAAQQSDQGQLIPQGAPPPNSSKEGEIHHYYGPNGERLPGPPSEFMRQRPSYVVDRKPYPSNFKIESTLEYGKMVSIRIREGNVSFRDIPDFVLTECQKTYRVIPRTEVTIVAEHGEYNVYATPDLQAPLARHVGYMYDPYQRDKNERRATVYPRSFSPNRRRPDHDIYTKKYNGDYFIDDSVGRRQNTHSHYRGHIVAVEPKEVPQRHWYSSNDNRAHRVHADGTRDPQRKPLPMKPMHLRKMERTA